ncbi:hypothetical protein PPSIR1_20314 [Plesiocystis pacifica SIR-1]|uniref:Uncharacterized protein n=1 Tax=Plesiocystis pacifica SIR-1 TaxID=391625 RepID=A6G239_9BACT|nr:hypothetical protein [Plesiocystis pacifica]EDM80008.1 hypothetical protein PPSIR1_20314 [Plesiocystis pacifica SIR-1]
MTGSQLAIMMFSFAGMVLFAGVAVVLYLRQQQLREAAPPPLPVTPKPAAPQASPIEEPTEPTEFVPARHGGPDPDAPRKLGESGTELVPAPHGPEDPEAELEATELVPVHHAPPDPEESGTELVSVHHAPPEERTAFVQPHFAPEPPPPAERTAMVQPRLEPEPPPQPVPVPAPVPAKPVEAPAAAPEPSTDHAHHFDLAVAALAESFEQLRSGAAPGTIESTHARWRGHLAVLHSADLDALSTTLRPALSATEPARRSAAWRALLTHRKLSLREQLPELVDGLDGDARAAAVATLASIADPRVERALAVGLEGAQAKGADKAATWRFWLEVATRRGEGPDDDAIAAALASSEPEILALGLRLLPRSSRRDAQRAQADSLVFAPNAAVRTAAIEASVTLGHKGAWLVARQLARNPSFPRITALVASLGTAAELDALAAALERPSLAAALALLASGRAAAFERCAVLVDDQDALTPEEREALSAALAAARGEGPSQSPEHRLLAGERRTGPTLSAWLRRPESARDPLLAHLCAELRVRTRGEVDLDPALEPDAWRRRVQAAAATLEALDLDAPVP